MCLAIPAKIEELLDDNMALASVGGAKQKVSLKFLSNIGVGDYVLVHVGFAMSKIEEEEAKETLALFDLMSEVV